MNKSGKVLTIFLVITAILLISLTAISMFFFQEEVKLRKSIQLELAQLKTKESTLNDEIKEAQKKIYMLEEKNKETDEKYNDLLDELELEQGIREELKIENQSLQENLEKVSKSQDNLTSEFNDKIEQAGRRILDLERQLENLQVRKKELEDMKEQMSSLSGTTSTGEGQVNLQKIVIAPENIGEGKVLSVDNENEFLIFNLGEKDGVMDGYIMSLYREEKYLGDVKVTRVQPEMSAADFVPPLNGRKVRKNDRVRIKQ